MGYASRLFFLWKRTTVYCSVVLYSNDRPKSEARASTSCTLNAPLKAYTTSVPLSLMELNAIHVLIGAENHLGAPSMSKLEIRQVFSIF